MRCIASSNHITTIRHHRHPADHYAAVPSVERRGVPSISVQRDTTGGAGLLRSMPNALATSHRLWPFPEAPQGLKTIWSPLHLTADALCVNPNPPMDTD